MIDIKLLEKEVEEASRNLEDKRKILSKAKENNLKELYGNDFCCDNCAYSCCVYVGDNHTTCINGHCIYCKDFCDKYIPENKLSKYLEENYYYDSDIYDALNDLFDVSDILTKEELYEKAIQVLKIANS